VLEKARSLGAHALSGALLEPRSMQELLPGFDSEASLDATVSMQSVYFLTRKSKFKVPVVPRSRGHDGIPASGAWSHALLHEGGPTLCNFLAAKAVDELFLTFSPQIAGRGAHTVRPGIVQGKEFVPNTAPWFQLLSLSQEPEHL